MIGTTLFSDLLITIIEQKHGAAAGNNGRGGRYIGVIIRNLSKQYTILSISDKKSKLGVKNSDLKS